MASSLGPSLLSLARCQKSSNSSKFSKGFEPMEEVFRDKARGGCLELELDDQSENRDEMLGAMESLKMLRKPVVVGDGVGVGEWAGEGFASSDGL